MGAEDARVAEEGELAVEGEQAEEQNATTTTTAPQQNVQQQPNTLTVSQLFPHVPSPPGGTQDSADSAQPPVAHTNSFVLLEDAQLLSGAHAQHAAQPSQPPPTTQIAAPSQPPPPLRSPPKAVVQGKGKATVSVGFQVAATKRKPGVKVATDHYTPAQLADVGLMVANK